LKIRIAFAREDSTAGKTMFVNCAFAVCVVGTSAARHRFNIFGAQLCRQIHQFRRGHKQTVLEFGEIATLAADLAHSCQTGKFTDLQIQPAVNFTYSFQELIVCLAFCHHFYSFFATKAPTVNVEFRISYLSFVSSCLCGYFFISVFSVSLYVDIYHG